LIDAVVYSDVFDCAVTLDELWRYSRIPLAPDDVQRRLEGDPVLSRAVSRRDGLYCLAGREELLALRPPRRDRARRLQRRATIVARVLQRLPFVRGVLLTGSAGADDADEAADVDLLVLVAPGRLSVVFTLLGGLSRALGRRVLCPNHYLATTCLSLERGRDRYLARELAQAYPLTGASEALFAANGWVRRLLPNAQGRAAAARTGTRYLLQRLLEWPLRGRLGDVLDQRLQRLALARLARHHRACDTTVPADVVDAARIDGAGWWQRFARIIVPVIAPILFIALLFDLIFTLSELTVVYLLTSGGPVDQTQVLANLSLQVGVSGSQLGQGAAIALYLLPVLLLLTFLALRTIGKREGL
jgi:predicted nucleotidyltransferase